MDHIKPAIKWWKNEIENGICASSFFNSKKKDNSFDNKFLFKNWEPTFYYYQIYWFIPNELKEHLINFNNLKTSDWYLNRAFQNLMNAIDCLNNPYNLKWLPIKRNTDYWSKASYKNIISWKQKSNNENINWLLNRLNINIDSLWKDQKIMLDITLSTWFEDIKSIAYKLLPYYKNSIYYFHNDDKSFINNEILPLRDKDVLSQKYNLLN